MTIQLGDMQFEEFMAQEKLEKIIKRVISDVVNHYQDFSDVVLVCVLNGAVPFFTEVCFNLPTDIQIDYIKVSSYGMDKQSSGKIDMILEGRVDVKGKKVLIVEDIVDTGFTQQFLLDYFKNKGAIDVKVCAMLHKSVNNKTGILPDFYGENIPDEFVIGYGLDCAQKGRNLRAIYRLKG